MYDDHKAKVFLVLLGQCTMMSTKDKVEQNDEFKKAEEEMPTKAKENWCASNASGTKSS